MSVEHVNVEQNLKQTVELSVNETPWHDDDMICIFFRWPFGKGSHQLAADHYGDVIMGAMASQITSLTIIYSTVYPDADQRNHQSSASLAFVRGIHR